MRAWRSDQVLASANLAITDACPKCSVKYRVWKPGSKPVSVQGGNASLLGRYTDGYRTARATNGFGQAIKAIGVILGGLVAVVAVATLWSIPAAGSTAALMGLLLGAVVGLPIYVLGVIVAAQGQILKATLDTAVNSSPLLSRDEMREIQSL
jgi:hypothetical protein